MQAIRRRYPPTNISTTHYSLLLFRWLIFIEVALLVHGAALLRAHEKNGTSCFWKKKLVFTLDIISCVSAYVKDEVCLFDDASSVHLLCTLETKCHAHWENSYPPAMRRLCFVKNEIHLFHLCCHYERLSSFQHIHIRVSYIVIIFWWFPYRQRVDGTKRSFGIEFLAGILGDVIISLEENDIYLYNDTYWTCLPRSARAVFPAVAWQSRYWLQSNSDHWSKCSNHGFNEMVEPKSKRELTRSVSVSLKIPNVSVFVSAPNNNGECYYISKSTLTIERGSHLQSKHIVQIWESVRPIFHWPMWNRSVNIKSWPKRESPCESTERKDKPAEGGKWQKVRDWKYVTLCSLFVQKIEIDTKSVIKD